MCILYVIIMGAGSEASNSTVHLRAEMYRQNITSPGYPDHYSNNIEYTWVIEACDLCVVVLVLSTVQIQHSPDCLQDRLVLYDGSETYDTSIGTVCGNSSGSFESSGKLMRITMSTDAIGQDQGYSGYYVAKLNDASTIAGVVAGIIVGLLAMVVMGVLVVYRLKTRRRDWFCKRTIHTEPSTYASGSQEHTENAKREIADEVVVCFYDGLCCKPASQVKPAPNGKIKQHASAEQDSSTKSEDVLKQTDKMFETENPIENKDTIVDMVSRKNVENVEDNRVTGLPPRPKIRSVKKRRAPAPPARPVSPPHVSRKHTTENGQVHPIQDSEYISKTAEETSELEMELVRKWSTQLSGNGGSTHLSGNGEATPIKESVKPSSSPNKSTSGSGSKRVDPHSNKKSAKRRFKSGVKTLKGKLNKKKREKISIVLYLDGGNNPSDIITEHVQFEDTTTGVNLNDCFKSAKPDTRKTAQRPEPKKDVESEQTPSDRGKTYVQSFADSDAMTTEGESDNDDAGVYLYRLSEVTETSETLFMYDEGLPNIVPVG